MVAWKKKLLQVNLNWNTSIIPKLLLLPQKKNALGCNFSDLVNCIWFMYYFFSARVHEPDPSQTTSQTRKQLAEERFAYLLRSIYLGINFYRTPSSLL